MTKENFIYQVEWIHAHYENFLMKLKGVDKPVFISPRDFDNLLGNIEVKGRIELARTREWFVFDKT